jgi:hypothetical protein
MGRGPNNESDKGCGPNSEHKEQNNESDKGCGPNSEQKELSKTMNLTKDVAPTASTKSSAKQ